MPQIARRAACILLFLFAASTATAETPAEKTAPQATEVLRSMADFLDEAQHFSFHAEVVFDVFTDWGQKAQIAGAGDVQVVRPNRLHAHFRDDMAERRLWFDGKQLTLLDPRGGFYAVEDFSGDIDAMFDDVDARLGLRLPLAELISSGPYDALSGRIERAAYLGIHDVEGRPAHHLALVLDVVDAQVWVQLDGDPLPVKLVIDYREVPGSPQYTAVLMDWNLGRPDADVFRARVPKGADRIRFLARKPHIGEKIR